jgi:hypothetical protein
LECVAGFVGIRRESQYVHNLPKSWGRHASITSSIRHYL